jgi:large subunit ribosomal protein L13
MKTVSAKPHEVIHKWYLIDAQDKVLGRLAATIAYHLRGKHKPIYTPHVDTGDYIVVINADKLRVTGNKFHDKLYRHHTGFQGGLKTFTFEKLMERDNTRALELAVKGMLPKNPLGRAMYKKVKIYAGSTHPHEAQAPEPLELN